MRIVAAIDSKFHALIYDIWRFSLTPCFSGVLRGKSVPGTVSTVSRTRPKIVKTVPGGPGLHNTPLKPNRCSWTRSSPSPRPSPSGRGRTVWQSQKKSPSSESENRSKKAPSPWGEGRGEGDRDVRTAWIGLKGGVNENGLLQYMCSHIFSSESAVKVIVRRILSCTRGSMCAETRIAAWKFSVNVREWYP